LAQIEIGAIRVERPGRGALLGVVVAEIQTMTRIGGPVAAPEIDIAPDSEENPIFLRAEEVISIAILGSDVFDVNDVDPDTLAFGPAGARTLHNNHETFDPNGDGFPDKVFHFSSTQAGIALGDTDACLTGETFSGTPFEACDAVTIVLRCGLGFELAFLLAPVMWLRQRRRHHIG
jgi:hypothetical protein